MLLKVAVSVGWLLSVVTGTILENGRERPTNYPNTTISLSAYNFTTYPANATELSYKGRWDSKKVSWWAAAGLKFGFTGNMVAVTFGPYPYTIDTTLIAYRVSGLDWQFTNVTAGGTHLLVGPSSPAPASYPISPNTLELRVTNWGYGVQVTAVHVAAGEKLVKIPDYPRSIEFIGDSLSAGMYGTYEALSGFAYGVGAGLGNTEYSVVAYPGICVADQDCWGNPRGQVHQWWYTSDGSWRQKEVWGTAGSDKGGPEPWDFTAHKPADIVVINLGTNDANSANNVPKEKYVADYIRLIQGIHGVYPKAQVILMEMWQGFYQSGNTFAQNHDLQKEVYSVYQYFNSEEYLSKPVTWNEITKTATTGTTRAEPFVHFFNTTGILQHNDIAPQWHPTDVGQIKVASHLIQYIRLKFGWELHATGPEIYHDTLYWNDQSGY